MHPAQRNKIDLSKLTPQEQQLFSKYGKLPTHKNILTKMQKDRKYFDSGDYALSKAGKAPQSTVGTAIPNPENIPHASTPTNGPNGHASISISPTNSMSKESGLANDQNTTPPLEADQTMEEPSAAPHTPASTTTITGATAVVVESTVHSSDPIAVAATTIVTGEAAPSLKPSTE